MTTSYQFSRHINFQSALWALGALRTLLLTLALVAVIAGAMALAVAVTPLIVAGLTAIAGKVALAAGGLAGYAWLFHP